MRLDKSLFPASGRRVLLTRRGRTFTLTPSGYRHPSRGSPGDHRTRSSIAGELLIAASSIPGEHLLPSLLSSSARNTRRSKSVPPSATAWRQISGGAGRGQSRAGGTEGGKPHLEYRYLASDRMVLVVPPARPEPSQEGDGKATGRLSARPAGSRGPGCDIASRSRWSEPGWSPSRTSGRSLNSAATRQSRRRCCEASEWQFCPPTPSKRNSGEDSFIPLRSTTFTATGTCSSCRIADGFCLPRLGFSSPSSKRILSLTTRHKLGLSDGVRVSRECPIPCFRHSSRLAPVQRFHLSH